jgi:Na+-transporting methylmalonyl-CoA/oxaloacetate decarboxylase gamma subunit
MSSIQQGLLITAIGMGLVFAVITLLWGVMALLVKVMSGSDRKDVVDQAPSPETEDVLAPELLTTERQRRAAAAAVAVQMALAQRRRPSLQKADQVSGAGLSPWQAVNRARQHQHKNLRGHENEINH